MDLMQLACTTAICSDVGDTAASSKQKLWNRVTESETWKYEQWIDSCDFAAALGGCGCFLQFLVVELEPAKKRTKVWFPVTKERPISKLSWDPIPPNNR